MRTGLAGSSEKDEGRVKEATTHATVDQMSLNRIMELHGSPQSLYHFADIHYLVPARHSTRWSLPVTFASSGYR